MQRRRCTQEQRCSAIRIVPVQLFYIGALFPAVDLERMALTLPGFHALTGLECIKSGWALEESHHERPHFDALLRR